MKKQITSTVAALALLFMACASFGANLVTFTVTFTNTPANGNSFNLDGSVVRFTNTPLNQTDWITAGNSNVSATNFTSFLSANHSQRLTIFPATNNVAMYEGEDISLFINSGAFATIVTNSRVLTNLQGVLYPADSLDLNLREDQANALAYMLWRYSTNAVWKILFTSQTNAQIATNLSLVLGTNFGWLSGVRGDTTNLTVRKGTNDGAFHTNVPAIYATNVFAQIINPDGSTSVLSGVISGGRLIFTSVTNAAWLDSTNAKFGTVRIDTLTVWTGATITNFSAPGSASFSQQIGSGGAATNSGAVQYGRNGLAGGLYDVSAGQSAKSFGYDIANGHNVTIGGFTETRGDLNVSVGGSIFNDGTNNTFVGNGIIAGAQAFGMTAIGASSAVEFDYSTAIGYGANPTAANQVRLGRSTETVSVPGALTVSGLSTFSGVATFGSISNNTVTGTNNWNGDVSYSSSSYGSLVDSPGNNLSSGITIGTNYVVELSGAANIANICSFPSRRIGYEFRAIFSGAITNLIVHNSGAEGTSALRINTGTGGNITQTNQPAWATFRKRSTDWLLLEHSR